MDKQIFELTREDICNEPVWFFPMDESVRDELTVRPAQLSGPDERQRLVRAKFRAVNGEHYVGYVYWSQIHTVDRLQPVMFLTNDECITFWNGLIEPCWEKLGTVQQSVRSMLPIAFESEANPEMESISGVLEGLYFITETSTIAFV